MKQEPDLTPFRYAWRGALGAFIGPFILIVFVASQDVYQRFWMLVYLPTFALILACTAGVGAITGFILGQLYVDRGKVRLWIRLFVGLGLPASLLTVVTSLSGADWPWVDRIRWVSINTLVIGLLPSLISTPLRAKAPIEGGG